MSEVRERQVIETQYCGEADRARMLSLVQAHPAENIHVIDLPYRLCSWALDSPANVALWESEQGELLAWAVLQSPFWSLDYALHPAAPRNGRTAKPDRGVACGTGRPPSRRKSTCVHGSSPPS